jgi:hypothetical protein
LLYLFGSKAWEISIALRPFFTLSTTKVPSQLFYISTNILDHRCFVNLSVRKYNNSNHVASCRPSPKPPSPPSTLVDRAVNSTMAVSSPPASYSITPTGKQ